MISLHPRQNILPFSLNGTTYPAYFNFSYLYTGPGTKYPKIPSFAPWDTYMDVTNNIEPDMSYYYLGKVADPAGSGTMMYHIWYGEHDNITPPTVDELSSTTHHSLLDYPLMQLIGASSDNPVFTTENWFAQAKLAWLSVPEDAVHKGSGTAVKLTAPQGSETAIYGAPISNAYYIIGNAPKGAIFVSAFTQQETGTQTQWYEINYNHRQAWVPASEVVTVTQQ